ncbi:MAG: metal ABC transporter substrate-binding protein [Nitrospirota bacterium]|jgi:ABC-type Zn uptake system ZnuABC Zn-binding protein ZnuA
MLTRTKATALFLLALLLTPLPAARAAEKKVVASVLPVWVFAANVAGERAEVALLVRSGADPHTFTLSPLDAGRLERADLVLLNGAGLEEHMLRALEMKKARAISDGVDLIMVGGRPDPHVWLDPVSAQRQVVNIAAALSAMDPEGRDYYAQNALRYNERLQALHEKIEAGISEIRYRTLITYHESFNYFARRYGLSSYSLTGPDAESPLPTRMRRVYDLVKSRGVPAVFEESHIKAGALERLSRDLGVEVCTLETVVSGEPSPGLYERAMERNLRSIMRCLGGD